MSLMWRRSGVFIVNFEPISEHFLVLARHKYKDWHSVKSVQIRSFCWSVFSHIRTEYREIRSISPYSVRMRENADHNNSE